MKQLSQTCPFANDEDKYTKLIFISLLPYFDCIFASVKNDKNENISLKFR